LSRERFSEQVAYISNSYQCW